MSVQRDFSTPGGDPQIARWIFSQVALVVLLHALHHRGDIWGPRLVGRVLTHPWLARVCRS